MTDSSVKENGEEDTPDDRGEEVFIDGSEAFHPGHG